MGTKIPFDSAEARQIAGRILRGRREELRLGRDALTRKQEVAAAGVTADYLVRLDSGTNRHDRAKFLAIAGALGLDQVQADALDWLLNGQPSAERDHEATVLQLIDAARRAAPPTDIQMFSASPEDRADFEEGLLRLEDMDQPRLTVTQRPPFITRPWEMQHAHQIRKFPSPISEAHSRVIDRLYVRYASWEQRVARNSFRTIVNRESINHYFAEGQEGLLQFTPDEIRSQGPEWIRRLESHSNYQVAPADTTLSSFVLIGISSVALLGDSPPAERAQDEGALGMLLTNPSVTMKFRAEFERQWRSLPEVNRDKGSTIGWLRALIGD